MSQAVSLKMQYWWNTNTQNSGIMSAVEELSAAI